ncbi:MAG: ABC transporter permease [Parasporobacterium sp.]|nr:ABC transporter permease [Parasporobacterium sp.]
MVRENAKNILKELAENAEGRVALEYADSSTGFQKAELEKIENQDNVAWINYLYEEVFSPKDLELIGDDHGDGRCRIHMQDKIQNDSPFEEKMYRVVKGRYPERTGDILINLFLAQANGLSVGDMLFGDHQITGMFLAGSERQQTDHVIPENRIENQIYMKIDSSHSKKEEDRAEIPLQRIVCYLEDPELLEQTIQEFREFCPDPVHITSDDHVYQKMKTTMTQSTRITLLILILTILTGGFISCFLLMMWIRSRKKEMAVFRSMGMSKGTILGQLLFEETFIFAGAFLISSLGSIWGLPGLLQKMELLSEADISGLITGKDLCMQGICGLLSVLFLTAANGLPATSGNIKNILSSMEE